MDRDFNKKDGEWFPVMHDLADKLMTYELTKIEHRVLWMFFRFCYGWNESSCEFQWKEMKDLTKLSDGSLSKAINRLKDRNILKTFQMESKKYITYKINSKLSTWKRPLSKRKDFPNGKQTLHKRKVNASHMESTPIKENKENKERPPISKKLKKNSVEIPEWIDKNIWNELKKYRKGKFTAHAQKLAITKLTQLRAQGHNPTDVINQTILRGWSGLFAVKKDFVQEFGRSTPQKTKKQLEYERIMKL